MKTREFSEGWDFVSKNLGAQYGALKKIEYIREINKAIDKLTDDLRQNFLGHGGNPQVFGGNVAEYWHGDTFNIVAELLESDDWAHVLASQELGSVDIILDNGKAYSLKYIENAIKSVRQQKKTVQNAYDAYANPIIKKGGTPLSPQEYLEKHGYESMEDMLYAGQHRLIPSDQLNSAKAWVKNQIDNVTDPNELAKYKELDKLLTDVLEGDDGVKSIALTKENATELAEILKKGKNQKPDEFKKALDEFLEKTGVETRQLVDGRIIVKQALKSARSAAIISLVLHTAPAIVELIRDMIKSGSIDISNVKQTGAAALSGGAEGFLTGGISAAITTAYLAGKFGGTASTGRLVAMPHLIAAATVIAVRAVKCSFGVVTGNMTGIQFADTMLKDITATVFSIGFGLALLPAFSVYGYMLGNFVGSIVGGFVYTGAKKLCLSFCVATGFTFFGLVKQDYTLPKEIIEELGIEFFEYEVFEFEDISFEVFEWEPFEYEEFEWERMNMHILRRGVIGVNTIGYVT